MQPSHSCCSGDHAIHDMVRANQQPQITATTSGRQGSAIHSWSEYPPTLWSVIPVCAAGTALLPEVGHLCCCVKLQNMRNRRQPDVRHATTISRVKLLAKGSTFEVLSPYSKQIPNPI